MKNIRVDIDGTICTITPDADYGKAEPLPVNIATINALYNKGHLITYWTARGSTTGKDWREITERQLESWGVKYHGLEFGKPPYDLLIDDKAINAASLRHLKNRG